MIGSPTISTNCQSLYTVFAFLPRIEPGTSRFEVNPRGQSPQQLHHTVFRWNASTGLFCIMTKLETSKPEVGENPQIIMFSPGTRFSKAPETFRARKAIFNSSASKNREVYTPETSGMKGTSDHIKNIWIRQLRNSRFCYGFTERFPGRAPVLWSCLEVSEECWVKMAPKSKGYFYVGRVLSFLTDLQREELDSCYLWRIKTSCKTFMWW